MYKIRLMRHHFFYFSFFFIRSTAAGTCSKESGVCVKAITHPLTLSEGPHWDIENQVLYFVDIVDQTLWCWNSSTTELTNTYISEQL